MKMYILVRDDLPVGFSIVAAAHASLALYLKYKEDADLQNWLAHSFRKVICRVNAKEFDKAKAFEKHLVLTESSLGNREVAIAFCPREEWPKPFKFYQLFK